MASGIPESVIQEIRARIDIADLIASYGIAVRRAGGGYKACCPFHHEKTPSFNIQPDKGYYHCFGCGESGDCFTFVQKQEGLSFVEAVKKLAGQCGVAVERKEDPQAGLRRRLMELHAQLSDFYRRCLLQAKEAEPARAYLASRALPDAVVGRFRIGYAPRAADAMLVWARKHGFTPEELTAAGVLLPPKFPGGRWYSRFAGRLMFTITDRQDRAIAFSGRILANDRKAAKYVNSPETAIFKKSNVLFALALAAPNIVRSPRREAIVCEGQIDVIRCHAGGFPVAVASQGTAFTEEHVRALAKCADSVVLVFDGDGAGQKAAIRTGGLFLAAGIPVRVATLPAGEDPDSFLRTHPPEAFQACLDAGESVTRFQVRSLLAGEAKPYTLRAVADVSRAALATIALCPSAVMRAALMDEAAALLGVPAAALQEDFGRLRDGRSLTPRPAAPEAKPVSVPSAGAGAPSAGVSGAGAGFTPGAGEDAAAPRVNPPPPRELQFCEFLFAHERDAALRPTVAAYAPQEVLSHPFARTFVRAWLDAFTSDADTVAEMRNGLDPAARPWLDAILLGNERSAQSELAPDLILQGFLRQLWMAAVRRRQGELPAEPSPETDLARLNYSTLIRHIQRDAWERAAARMTPAALA